MKTLFSITIAVICMSNSAFLCAETLYYDNSVYVGEVVNSKRHGQGTIEFTDGVKYEGGWFLGTKRGNGTATWPDGSRYVGEWLNDKKHGQGTFTRADGSNQSGFYELDTYVGYSVKPEAPNNGPATEYAPKIVTEREKIEAELKRAEEEALQRDAEAKSASSTNLIWFLGLAILAAGSCYFFFTDRKQTEKSDLPVDGLGTDAIERSKEMKPKTEDTESEEKSPIVMTLIKTAAVIPPFMLLGALMISASEGYPFDPMEVASGQSWLAFVLWPFAVGYLIWKRSSKKTSEA